MAERRVTEIPEARIRDAVDIIAAAERARSNAADAPSGAALESGAGDRTLSRYYTQPQGLDGLVDRAVGAVDLPSLIDLKAAVERVRDGFVASPDLAPELTSTALAVMDEELMKIDRYLELRER